MLKTKRNSLGQSEKEAQQRRKQMTQHLSVEVKKKVISSNDSRHFFLLSNFSFAKEFSRSLKDFSRRFVSNKWSFGTSLPFCMCSAFFACVNLIFERSATQIWPIFCVLLFFSFKFRKQNVMWYGNGFRWERIVECGEEEDEKKKWEKSRQTSTVNGKMRNLCCTV